MGSGIVAIITTVVIVAVVATAIIRPVLK